MTTIKRQGGELVGVFYEVSGTHKVNHGVVQALTSDGYLTFADDSANEVVGMPTGHLQDNTDGTSGAVKQGIVEGIFEVSGVSFSASTPYGGTCWVHADSSVSGTITSPNTGSNSRALGKYLGPWDGSDYTKVKVGIGQRGLFDLDESA